MKAGATAHDVHTAVSKGFHDRGFKLGHVTGHSIGMTMIEFPRIGEGNEFVLRENMVVSMHPHAITQDERACLYMQDTWRVTPEGGRAVLGRADPDLHGRRRSCEHGLDFFSRRTAEPCGRLRASRSRSAASGPRGFPEITFGDAFAPATATATGRRLSLAARHRRRRHLEPLAGDDGAPGGDAERALGRPAPARPRPRRRAATSRAGTASTTSGRPGDARVRDHPPPASCTASASPSRARSSRSAASSCRCRRPSSPVAHLHGGDRPADDAGSPASSPTACSATATRPRTCATSCFPTSRRAPSGPAGRSTTSTSRAASRRSSPPTTQRRRADAKGQVMMFATATARRPCYAQSFAAAGLRRVAPIQERVDARRRRRRARARPRRGCRRDDHLRHARRRAEPRSTSTRTPGSTTIALNPSPARTSGSRSTRGTSRTRARADPRVLVPGLPRADRRARSDLLTESVSAGAESVPFRVVHRRRRDDRADVLVAAAGRGARRGRGARVAAVVRAGQAAPQLHAPRDRLLRRGRADLGPPLGRGGDRHAARGARLAADRERDPARSTRRSGSTTTRAPPATPTSAGCRRSSTSTTTSSPATVSASTTSRRPCPRSARTATSRTSSRSPAPASCVRGGVILHRYGLGSWQRGREVIWSKALAALQVPDLPDDPRPRDLRARRRPLARLEDVRLQRERGRERGGPAPARVRARGARRRAASSRTAPAGTTRSARARSARRTWTWSAWSPTSA